MSSNFFFLKFQINCFKVIILLLRTELLSFIPRVLHFINTYVEAKTPPGKSDWQGQILSIQDIEENIWLPNLGIKGKVDVTVKVRSRGVVKVSV